MSVSSASSASPYKILTINPGSTSTKISLFVGEKEAVTIKLSHDPEEISRFNRIIDQKEYRSRVIREGLAQHNYRVEDLDAIVGRGGLLRPIPSGTYLVNEAMLKELAETPREHASNLGAILAHELAQIAHCPAYIVDPVVVDEFESLARYSGSALIERISIFHALNQKAVARKVAQKIGKRYEDCNFVVAHMGGGISIGAHKQGRVIDNNNALDGEGPFSPERTGTLPTGQWMGLVLSGKYSASDLKKIVKGSGGMMSYCGTSDAMEVEKRIESGDKKAEEVMMAMCYQVAKDIGAYATTLKGKVDAIILTGGLAFNNRVTNDIRERTGWIAPIEIIPGENEMTALWEGGKRVLEGTEKAKNY